MIRKNRWPVYSPILAILPSVFLTASCRDEEMLRQALELHQPQIAQGAKYVGSETCGLCHEKQVKEFKSSTHERISIPIQGTPVEGCEMCHGPGSLHADAEGKKPMITLKKNPDMCFACHMEKQAEFNLPYRHPVLEGKMPCADCHDPHGEEVRPWTGTSLGGINETCFKCHKEQRGPFVWEHEAVRDGCPTCHTVHGSIHDKMLYIRDNNLCLRCHTQSDFPTIGKSGHGGRLYQGPCFAAGCHTAPHGSNFDEHLRY